MQTVKSVGILWAFLHLHDCDVHDQAYVNYVVSVTEAKCCVPGESVPGMRQRSGHCAQSGSWTSLFMKAL